MKKLHLVAGLAAILALGPGTNRNAHAGLEAPADDWLWPQVQARITLSTASLAPVSLVRTGEAASRGILGGALLGDYVFAAPAFGNLRATSGLLLGTAGGTPLAGLASNSRLSVNALESPPWVSGGSEPPHATPYLGLGYSTPLAWRSLSMSADFGLVAERPSSIPGFGRALFGSGGLDAAWREMRIAPMLQLSVRYSF